VDADKSVQAYLKGRKKLVLFDDVDVGLMIEHKFARGAGAPDGQHPGGRDENRAPIGCVLRAANRKSYIEIHREIRARQAETPQRKEMPPWMRFTLRLPGPLPRLMMILARRQMRNDPAAKWVALAGTVGLSAVGMFGEGGGWGLGTPDNHTLSVIVGGIATRPVPVGGRVEEREFLSLTLTFNHDVVDGAPAARFTHRLKDLIEGACGLEELAC
jgi:pyruvate/2-oxoglutarate dehydrogenase complex dihydrolipoamide acyltransferase (E2) component